LKIRGIKLKCLVFVVVLKVWSYNESDSFVIASTCVLGFLLSSVAALMNT